MTPGRSFARRTAALLLLYATGVASAWAALGGAPDTVDADATALHVTRHVANARTGFQVHELTLASGTVVREFVAPSGAVFAVAWQGPFKPDLNQLLGSYFPRVVAAGKEHHADHRWLAVHAPDLVIESGGRMRAFAGRAYLPELMPVGAALGDIQ